MVEPVVSLVLASQSSPEQMGMICSDHMTNAGTAQVNVAQQIYDLVDQRILQLDRNLQSFDTALIRQRHELDLPVSSCMQTSSCLPCFV